MYLNMCAYFYESKVHLLEQTYDLHWICIPAQFWVVDYRCRNGSGCTCSTRTQCVLDWRIVVCGVGTCLTTETSGVQSEPPRWTSPHHHSFPPWLSFQTLFLHPAGKHNTINFYFTNTVKLGDSEVIGTNGITSLYP